MKQLTITIISILLSSIVYGQTDTEFWFVAPEATDQHGDQPIYLRVAGTGTASTVTISQPANPNFPIITQGVPASSITSINLTKSTYKVSELKHPC